MASPTPPQTNLAFNAAVTTMNWRCALLLLVIHSATAYKVAYVEHVPLSACGSGSCGPQTRALNVKAYVAHMHVAATKGAQIIVFPEYGITGESSYGRCRRNKLDT